KRDPRSKPVEEQKIKQVDTRTRCKKHMIIRKKADKWVVTVVEDEHNHILVSPKKRHKLRSQRHISDGHEKIIDNIRLSRIKTNLAMNFLGLESGGVQNIGFTAKDVRNYLSVKRSLELKNGLFSSRSLEIISNLYSITLSANKQITHHSSTLSKLTQKAR
ncbi:hypothetical protein MKX03_021072, partial [Papaver bracteatum]